MQALKILVVVMGLMIVAGFTVIAVTIFIRATTSGADAPGAPVAGAFGTVELALPAGASVVDSTIDDGRLLVRLRLADGTTRLMVVDMASGGLLGTVDLRPEADK